MRHARPRRRYTATTPLHQGRLRHLRWVEDPLNWLNQCKQFFRGQRTLESDPTWLVSYHLRGAAQTWYYSLEQDEGGMPPWDRFRELCLLRFGPPIRGSRFAELGRLLFTSTVQASSITFKHSPATPRVSRGNSARSSSSADSRITYGWTWNSRLPMTCRRRCTTLGHMSAGPRRCSRLPRAAGPGYPPAPAGRSVRGHHRPPPAATPRTFRRLTPAEQLEHHRLGLCFNCDEPYAPGHVCPRLIYLETVDDGDADTGIDTATETALDAAPATTCVVSLHALAGIRNEHTMLLPVTIHGEQLVALLDTGSTHNFLPETTMRRLGLQPMGGDHLRVTVANGDRLRCHGVAQHVPLSIGDEHFTITCAGIDLGCFDFILGVDFLRPLGRYCGTSPP
ncbi:hypothetical protein QYE76_033502 [Lolium multiflorum]|uniref:Retrotransposon gag domain-containing protein n=1 Tax=Lolium multiflorum TaxID=4521 RepID=A0AAD8VKD1_LOLMU|nr:hypothetical protein QYE76_033502 [Lolium multiflorum]